MPKNPTGIPSTNSRAGRPSLIVLSFHHVSKLIESKAESFFISFSFHPCPIGIEEREGNTDRECRLRMNPLASRAFSFASMFRQRSGH